MGSGGSKCVAAPPNGGGGGSGADDGEKSGRWRGERVLGMACLCLPFSSSTSDDEQDSRRVRRRNSVCTTDDTTIKSPKADPTGHSKLAHQAPTCSSSSGAGRNQDCHESASYAEPGDSTSATNQAAAFNRSLNYLNHFCSHFGSIADRIISRLGQVVSVRSSGGAHSDFSAQNPEYDDHVHVDCNGNGSSANRNRIHECHIAVDTLSARDTIGSDADAEAGVTRHFHWNNVRIENSERRPSRRHGLQDPLEGSIQFSRTLSVGRLRDRVLRRPSFSDGSFDPMSLENRLAEYCGDGSGRRALHQTMRRASSDNNTDIFTTSTGSLSSSMDSNHDYASEIPRLREASIRDTLEHRSEFLERRRRIRSQVRALQRLGSRVENIGQLIEHESSCILSGQHRTGRCTCRISSRFANSVDGTSTRSSISRIVMLAEALFEVLDEIHQQSVVMASQPSASSIGSVPAPKEVVECMPLRKYGKSKVYHNNEATQCRICLVEYEEGDYIRILPCHHEFHRKCVDKWLKEIHRVCPLCRGDVCMSEMPHVKNLN